MTTNSHMFAVRVTTFWVFCVSALSFILCVAGYYGSRQEVPRQYRNSVSLLWRSRPGVCVFSLKGVRAAEVQSQVHVLKCSPRDGPYYPCLLHQQGPGAGAGSWPFVSKQMEMGRGGKKWGNQEVEGERVSLFSLSAALKKTSPHNASAAADGPPLIQPHALTICIAGVCHKVCARMRTRRTAQSGELKLRYSLGFNLVKIFSFKSNCWGFVEEIPLDASHHESEREFIQHPAVPEDNTRPIRM